jgi:hypothetical protein
MLEDEGILNRGYCRFCALFFTISNDVHHISVPVLKYFVNMLMFILSFEHVCFKGFTGYNSLLE